MAKSNLEQKRFSRLSEAAIAYQTKNENQKPLVKALVEAYNTKFKTRFYFDEKRSEIIHANLVSEATFADYKKLSGLLQSKGVKTNIKESVVQNLNGLSRLVESELAQAEIILAAQSLSDRLQKMAEDLAQMVSEDVLPISDQMKSVFGSTKAEKWSELSKSALEQAFSTISLTKDTISNANLVLERFLEGGDQPSDDMANFADNANDQTDDDLDLGDSNLDSEDSGELDDFMGGSDAASGPEDEPLGRAKKESRHYKKKSLTEDEFSGSDDRLDVHLPRLGGAEPIAEYNGYVLARDTDDEYDGHNRKIGYAIYKITDVDKNRMGGMHYPIVKRLKNNPYKDDAAEINSLWSKIKNDIDNGVMGKSTQMTDEDRSTGQMNSYAPIMRKTQAEQPFVLTHDGNAILITKGHNTTDDSASFYDDEARDLLRDLANTDQSEHQQILAHYYTSKYNVIDRDRANISPEEWSRLSEHEDHADYVSELESEGYTVEVNEQGDSLIFVVSKGNKTVFIEEPNDGVYQVMAFEKKYPALKDAVAAFFNVNEANCKMVRERNAFAHAVRKAKSIGADNFEVDGKKYPVKEDDNEDLADKAIDALKGDKKPNERPNPVEDKLKKDMANTIQRNPQLRQALSKMQEAIATIKEDISLGINEKLAIRNSSMIFELPLQDLREEWMARKK